MAAKLRAPGWYRAGLFVVLGVLFSAALVTAVRAAYGFSQPFEADGWDGSWQNAVLTVSLIATPLFFLVGLGAFDYWFYWASGRPTRPEDHSSHGATSWKDYFRVNTDHKVIGIQYVVTSFFFMLVGGLLAMLVRAELAAPGSQFVDPNAYNGLFSVHASLMIFLFIIPVFAGLANYVLPLMIGAPDMAFPRLNALSYWMLPVAGVMMTASFFAPGGSFATGWTAYAPLSTEVPIGQLFFTIGVQFAGASSIATALNFLVTIITMRAPGMSFWRMPLLVWANFSTSLLVVIATPFVAASQFFVLLDYALGFNFFVPERGGDILMYQHVFWFYSHPAVYIMMLPGFGIISEIISVKSRKPIFGYRMMAFSLLAIVDARLHGLGPPHVRVGHAAVDPDPDDGDHRHHRRPDRDQDLLLAGHAVARRAAPGHADAVRARLPHHVHARRDLRRDAGDDPRDHPRERHVLHRRPHPLRALRRVAVHDLRGRLLLVPEDDGPDVRRDARPDPLLDDVRRLQRDVRAHAPHRRAGHAAARGRLPRAVRRLEPVHLAVELHPRLLHAGLRLQHRPLAGAPAHARRRTRGGRSRSSGRSPRRRRSSTSTACPRSSAGRTSTACPARSTASSSPPGRRRRPRDRPPSRPARAAAK